MKGFIKKAVQMGILAAGMTVAMGAGAEAKTCSQLTEDLRAMQKAQSSLLETMVRKNESMASTLDEYATTFSVKKNLRKADLTGMKRSAQAFRNHQDREEKLVQRFESKTEQLISQIEDCLKSKTLAAE